MYNNIENYLGFSGRSSMGEVQTPNELAQEMINKLPEEIFISDKTTFLDPCFGSGTYLKEIALKLRKYGHSKENINSRLIGVEKSIRFINKIQQLQGFNPTLIHADFLKYDFKDMKFDVVVGNPPYNGDGGNSTGKLWVKFVDFGIKLLTPKGKLLFVTPNTWINGTSKNYTSFKENKVLFAKFYEQNPFSSQIGTSTSYFVIENSTSNGEKIPTQYQDKNNKVISFDLDYVNGVSIPTKIIDPRAFSILEKVVDFNSPLPIKHDSRLHTQYKLKYFNPTPSTQTPEKAFHSNRITHYFNFNDVKFTPQQIEEHKSLKVIIPKMAVSKTAFITSNQSTTQDGRWIVVKDHNEGEKIVKFIKSNLIQFVDRISRISQGSNNKLWTSLKDIRNLTWDTDQDLYEHFKLTQEEIDLIESTIK